MTLSGFGHRNIVHGCAMVRVGMLIAVLDVALVTTSLATIQKSLGVTAIR